MEADQMEKPEEGQARPLDAYRELQCLQGEVLRLRQQNAEQQRLREELLHSRSWRLTAPIRWLITKLRRQASPDWQQAVEPVVVSTPGTGRGRLPDSLLLPQLGSIDGANATCRLLDLSPGLEGLLPAPARLALDDVGSRPAAGGYLGWRGDAPAIGFLGGDELRVELSFDARVVEINEQDWDSVLMPGALRFIVVETVWHVGERGWRYALVRDGGRSERFLRLLEHCRRISLPLVLWFRESPGNYEQFAWLAAYADLVCVADSEVARRLRRDYPDTRVDYLPPAIQPALHNPLRSYQLRDAADALGNSILFDGWWDLQGHLAELQQLRELQPHGLLIAESEWDFGRVRLADNPEFEPYAIGCLDQQEKLVMSRLQGAEVFAADPLAGAWRSALRMVRSAAAGSLVVRLDGAEPPLPELRLPGVGETGAVAALLAALADPLARARRRQLVWRGLMSAHTIAHRLQFIADALAVDAKFLPPEPRIACLLVSMRPELLSGCIERFRNDRYPHKELIVVVHDDVAELEGLRAQVREGEAIRFFRLGRSCSLGACLNFAISQTDAPYWTKMDDDDLYGPDYLSDVMLYQRLGNFSVFGKPPVFNYLESGDELIHDPEWARHANLVHGAAHAYAALVAGGTLGGKREVLEKIPFSEHRRGGSDSGFVRRCYRAGLDVLAMDGFNFVRCRSSDPGSHTWRVSDDEIRLRSMVVGKGADVPGISFV
ncbi:glycosyltransferase [Luteimonas sp. BDR2-5]|uniref:glycosyltransferase n=1 Tax=Proluteimonas luteida TaxID=2878685 RepID=UPI001E481A0C|nr:glycosyltransferase [Luteimonas sp. BDR2-5]MCD9027307.1 glycosyltransferase [Luteimonas sp. BDR2-5]